jgi:nitrous oxidase accessory protein NosD
MSGNIVSNNHMGGNFFRSSLQIRQNKFLGNLKEGLRLREGATVMEENLVDGNRYGVMIADTFAGRFTRNVVTNNAEIGLSVKNADNIEVSANFVAANGLNGVSVQDVRAEIRGNQIAENGERGIGILTFTGVISGNNFMDNRLFAIDHEGRNEVDATGNWWGGGAADAVIFDGKDDPSRGKVVSTAALPGPVPFTWPLAEVSTPAIWAGEITIDHRVEVTADASLTIKPGTRVAFAEGAGLTVLGKLLARGEQGKKVLFTSLQKKEPGAWDEVLLEHANDSIIAHATFEYANWGLHSHFTNLSLSDSEFRDNSGGMRFRSGPVSIAGCLFTTNGIGLRSYMGNGTIQDSTFTGNEIGIFVREKGSGLHISRSNLYNNTNYNVRVGDFNDEDVDARGNWWGGAAPAATIFDGRNEAGIGKVIYEPFLLKPVANLFMGVVK